MPIHTGVRIHGCSGRLRPSHTQPQIRGEREARSHRCSGRYGHHL